MDDVFTLMQEIKEEADNIYNSNRLDEKGFIKCNIFGNLLNEYKILFLGINPGGDVKDVCHKENEIEFYRENPHYNEFIEENYSLIWGLKKLYRNAFVEENVDFMLKNTFYWNLCLSRTKKPASEILNKINKANDLYWGLFSKIVENVKPNIILTFVSNVSFLESKLNIRFQNDRIIENIKHYYYRYDNLNINKYTVKKIIAINHLSQTYYNKDEWESVGSRFKNDYEQALYQNSKLPEYEKHDINYDKSNIFEIDSLLNPVDDLETILFLNKRKSKLKWKAIIMHLHHALYMYCIAILQGTNPDEVTNAGYDSNKNILFKKGDDKWKKSRIIRYKDTHLFQFAWDYVNYEPEIKNISIEEDDNSNRNLIGFWTAIARIQDGEFYMSRYIDSQPILLSEEEKESILIINKYRNKFEHFIPTMWSIDINLLKNTCSIIVNIIEKTTKSFEFQFFTNKGLLEKNDILIKELKSVFNS